MASVPTEKGKTMREKLIELLDKVLIKYDRGCLPFVMNEIADHLIANGVTVPDTNVRKWISVKDRLPDKDTLVLCIGSKGGMFLGYVRFLYGDDTTAYTRVPNSRSSRHTEYWMPLPEPPKGE